MKTVFVFFVFLGIFAALIFLKIWRYPDIFEKAPASTFSQKKDEKKEKDLIPSAADFFDEKLLRVNDILLSDGFFDAAVMRHAPISPADDFFAVTFSFEQKDNFHGSVSRFLPKKEMSTGRLFSIIRQKLSRNIGDQMTISPPLSSIPGVAANFYLNDKKNFPDTIFLVVRSQKKVLAFQYKKKYHDAVKKYISLFFR